MTLSSLQIEVLRKLRKISSKSAYALMAFLIAVAAGPAFVVLFEHPASWHLKGVIGIALCWSLFVSMYVLRACKEQKIIYRPGSINAYCQINRPFFRLIRKPY